MTTLHLLMALWNLLFFIVVSFCLSSSVTCWTLCVWRLAFSSNLFLLYVFSSCSVCLSVCLCLSVLRLWFFQVMVPGFLTLACFFDLFNVLSCQAYVCDFILLCLLKWWFIRSVSCIFMYSLFSCFSYASYIYFSRLYICMFACVFMFVCSCVSALICSYV